MSPALEVVFFHHEKVKGKGYPSGLTSGDIPVSARIFAIADVPRTLNLKKLEVPVKKILAGVPVEKAVNVDSMSNPESIDYFVLFAAERQEKK